jgi:DNA-binding response OmpR family regulator
MIFAPRSFPHRFPSVMVCLMRVLIADDDRRLGSILVKGMATGSIFADLVSSGREAIQRRARRSADPDPLDT